LLPVFSDLFHDNNNSTESEELSMQVTIPDDKNRS